MHPGFIREDFMVTPNMSTYLVAFMVSDLVNTNASTDIGETLKMPKINIWSRKNVADMTKYEIEIFVLSTFFYKYKQLLT